MHNGILQFIDGTAARQYGINNSSNSILPLAGEFVRIPSSTFDNQGNFGPLHLASDVINRRNPTGSWESVDVSEEYPALDGANKESTTKLVVTRAGMSFGTTGLGIVAYNPGNNSYGQLINEIQQRKLDQFMLVN
jgi:hypothetical protein